MLIKLCNIDYNREITIVAEIMAKSGKIPQKKYRHHRTRHDPDLKSGDSGDHP